MKKYFLALALLTIAFTIVSCEGSYMISTQLTAPVHVRPASPGAEYKWVDGDWIYEGGHYVWHEGYWGRRRGNKRWEAGRWESKNNGWYWRRGHWR